MHAKAAAEFDRREDLIDLQDQTKTPPVLILRVCAGSTRRSITQEVRSTLTSRSYPDASTFPPTSRP
jgi:hypothetical protein